MSEHLLSVKDLHTSFTTDNGEVHAVNGVSFNLDAGKVLGIVGESGSGKSVTAYSIMQILADNGRITGGSVEYKGQDITKWNRHQMAGFRGKCCSIIFQDPMTSLNPVFTIGNQLEEAIRLHTNKRGAEAKARAIEMLTLVGVNEPAKRVKQYPYELSGGMRQRVMIAMALACEPDILIADEPTTALDVTIQAQILELMQDLQKKLGMAIIMVTHDLGVIATMCDEIIVMYGGRIKYNGEVIFDAGDLDENGEPKVDAKGNPVKGKATTVNMLPYRKQMQMVFQDPYSSLNPRMTVEDIIGEPLDVHKLYTTKAERREKVLHLMELVGLNAEHATRYAHEFSGGQRQRIGIARALAVDPRFIVCDEPVSALDVSIQAQVVNMFEDLQHKLGVAYLFIAHDLLVVNHISDRIAVMYLGKMMELAEAGELMNNPIHPYTQSLLSAVPMPDPKIARERKRIVLEGDVPSPLKAPSGCPFRTRCRYATEQCAAQRPPLTDRGNGHMVACWNK